MRNKQLIFFIYTACVAFAQSYSAVTIAGTTVIRDGIPAREAALRGPTSVAADLRGNIYVADAFDNRIRKIASDGVITTIAGTGVGGFAAEGVQAATARISLPVSLALDRTGTNLYFTETGNFRVRRINLTTGELFTVAGNGSPRTSGDNGLATLAGLTPFTLALDTTGAALYICDPLNAKVRKVDLETRMISTFAGNGTIGFGGDNQPAPNAQLAVPQSIAFDANYAYIADWGVSLIRRVDLKTNVIATWAGCGLAFDFGDNGPVGRSCLVGPDAVSVDSEGNLLIIDSHKIRQVAAGGDIIRTFAGGPIGFAGDGTETLTSARFALPGMIISVRRGDYLIADTGNYRLRRILNGTLTTMAGTGAVDGLAAPVTKLNLPTAIARDAAGNIYIADTANHRIRKIATGTNIVSTIAGTGVSGTSEGRIDSPAGIAVTPEGTVYFSDSDNNRIYRIGSDGIRLIAGAANAAAGFTGDGQIATSARLRNPRGLALDANGNLYVADSENGRVRRINFTDNVISTVAGNGNLTASGDGGQAIAAGLAPANVAVDGAGNLYISDELNSRVRKVTAGVNTSSTSLGGAGPGNSGDGGPSERARIDMPQGLNLDSQGNLFVTDMFNFNVRRVDGRTGVVTTIAGTGLSRGEVESGPALGVNMVPTDIAVEPNGNLLIADSVNDRIRRLAPLVPRNLVLVSGNNTTGRPGGQALLTVKTTDAAGVNVAGVLVNFVVVSGDATLRPAAQQTAIDGTAATQVTFGEATGAIVVRAESAGLTPVVFNLTNAEPVVVKLNPLISSITGVSGSSQTISMNSLAAIAGTELSTAAGALTAGAPDLVQGKLPVRFNGACVEVSGIRAPLLSVSSTRIVFQTPEVPSPAASVRVIAGCGTANEFTGEPKEVATAAASPEFFLSGQGNAVTVLDLASGATVSTVQPGSDVIVFLHGLGATEVPIEPGSIVADNILLKGQAALKLDGKPIDIVYAGTTAEFPGANAVGSSGITQNAGIFQVRFLVPADATEGDLPISLSVGENVSPEGTVLTVRLPVEGGISKRRTLRSIRGHSR